LCRLNERGAIKFAITKAAQTKKIAVIKATKNKAELDIGYHVKFKILRCKDTHFIVKKNICRKKNLINYVKVINTPNNLEDNNEIVTFVSTVKHYYETSLQGIGGVEIIE
jgi:hypothetical protein